jgi:hypothetical protein
LPWYRAPQDLFRGYDFGYTIARVVQLTGLETDQILKPGKQTVRVYPRSLICHWAIRSLGRTAVAVSELLGISQSAITRAADRGEAIAAAHNLEKGTNSSPHCQFDP